jgi:integrase
MPSKTKQKELPLVPLFERFIRDSEKGKRLQPNGKKISQGTVNNYRFCLQLLHDFSNAKSWPLRIKTMCHLNTRQAITEKNYWKKFYRRFTDYLYHDCGHYDNYVGQTIKNIRVFFNYLNKDLALGVGDFHKQFYVRKEEVPIFPLLPEELNFLIYDCDFESRLDKRMKEVKDFFVFGCTVALRVSDLFILKQSNLRIINGAYYLAVRSKKTSTDTLVKLPPYAIAIVQKYSKRKKLLPHFNKTNLNKYIKRLLEAAGYTSPVQKQRERRGEGNTPKIQLRFCDVASTHTMRRTAITTMLCLGMPEQVVRKISGHSPSGKEFYRYVLWAQTYQDQESEKLFEKLQQKRLEVA